MVCSLPGTYRLLLACVVVPLLATGPGARRRQATIRISHGPRPATATSTRTVRLPADVILYTGRLSVRYGQHAAW